MTEAKRNMARHNRTTVPTAPETQGRKRSASAAQAKGARKSFRTRVRSLPRLQRSIRVAQEFDPKRADTKGKVEPIVMLANEKCRSNIRYEGSQETITYKNQFEER